MQENSTSFDVLQTQLLEKLKSQGCTDLTTTGYRYLSNRIFSWIQDNGCSCYTKEAGAACLSDYLVTHSENQYYTDLRTVVYRLNDLLDNTWKNTHSDKGRHFSLSSEFINVVSKYCSHEIDKGLASGTIRNKRYAVSWFLEELCKLNCTSLHDLSSELITMACIKMHHNLWGEIKVFLKYLIETGDSDSDFSTLVPHYSKSYVIPSVYSVDEIKCIENAVGKTTILGKRDYAIILLASRMGLRASDIVSLKIKDVKYKDEINIVQKKTGKPLHLPLITAVSEAIEDYLKVRPASTVDELFLNVYAPHNPITTGTVRNVVKRYIRSANIDVGKRKKGPHALRSSLASSMVNDDISYETVRKILGHSSNNAIKHYARIDIEKLRPYCLEPPQITGNFRVFLYGEDL